MTPDDLLSAPARGSSRRAHREAIAESGLLQHPPVDEPSADEQKRPRKRRTWLWIRLGVLLVIVGAITAVALIFFSEVRTAQAALERAKTGLTTLTTNLGSADQATISATAGAIAGDVAVAAETVEGPLWNLAARAPFVGQNIDAVQRVTRAVDVLVDRALPPGMQFLSAVDFDQLTVEGGGINLEPFRQVQKSIPEISAAFVDAQALIAPIDTASLLPQVAGPIGQVTTLIDQATPALATAEKYLPTLLDIAGSGGTKTYLVLFQNNAEIRATGGNAANGMILTITDGKLGYVDQTFSELFLDSIEWRREYLSLPDATTGLYLPTMTSSIADYNFTPDFPTTAQLFRALWQQASATPLDGVISIDPVVLSHMLAVASPVVLATGEQLTADNVVKVLLSDSYERYPNPAQSDVFFSDTAKRVFDHLTTASWDPIAMLGALEKSAEEQRIYLSFLDPAAQALAVEFGVDGALMSDNAAQTQVGIYLNDYAVGKLDYHLTSAITATCDASARTMTTTMTLHNAITSDIRSNYTLGWRNGRNGLPRTTMMLDVLFFAPPGAQILQTSPAVGDLPRLDRSGVEKDNTGVSRTVLVPKDETVSVSYTVALPAGDLGPLNLRHTPTANDTAVAIDASCDALFPRSD
ncbi:DUF4012 domain-containing protein [Microbacterium sp. PRC9]|uniref:DUF4012 domain-containing protein n=1 Tax=Microbacterium sp. PRC9 TaxID=2962591 RepID=UPI0028824254|nr:DUF4012 domain-containing protein [Microbacterium sp. PRC9]MDT0141483.1 DUF4012 domain-containing protein [Microbacterium sp. PRC9]